MSQNSASLIARLGQVFKSKGKPLWMVGGTVRDLLLNRDIKDLDATTLANEKEIEAWMEEARFFPFRKNNRGDFQTISLKADDLVCDITPFRGPLQTLEDDLGLRDFTLNAMAIPADDFQLGNLVDPFGGVKDLQDRILDTPNDPDLILKDDPLRVLRAARMATKFGLETHPRLLKALEEAAPMVNFDRLSPERIRDEVLAGLDSEKPSDLIRYYDRIGVLPMLFPEISAMKGMEQNTKVHHKDVFEHTLLVMDNAAGIKKDPFFILGALLHDAGKVKTRRLSEKGWTFYNHDIVSTGIASRVTKQLLLGKKDRDLVVNVVAHHMRLYNYSEDWTDTAVRRVVRELGDHFEDIMLMSKADITGQNPKARERKMRKVDAFMSRVNRIEMESIQKPKPPIDGLRIMELLEVTPHKGGGGPLVGLAMNYLKQMVIDGELATDDVEKAEEIIRSGVWRDAETPSFAPVPEPTEEP